MTRPLRVALVGLGTISQRGILSHLELEDARELIELRAVCDVDADRAAATAADHGVARWYVNRDPRANAEHARHVIEIVEQGYASAHAGRTNMLRTAFSSDRYPTGLLAHDQWFGES